MMTGIIRRSPFPEGPRPNPCKDKPSIRADSVAYPKRPGQSVMVRKTVPESVRSPPGGGKAKALFPRHTPSRPFLGVNPQKRWGNARYRRGGCRA